MVAGNNAGEGDKAETNHPIVPRLLVRRGAVACDPVGRADLQVEERGFTLPRRGAEPGKRTEHINRLAKRRIVVGLRDVSRARESAQ